MIRPLRFWLYSCLALLGSFLTGCEDGGQPVAVLDAIPVSQDNDDLPDDLDPEIRDAVRKAKNPIIKGLLMGLNEKEVRQRAKDEQGVDLVADLLEADKQLTKIKADNREAIRQANRQVTVNQVRTPNIILVAADGLKPGDLGPYGQELIQTPALRQLASRGTTFTQFYAGATTPAGARQTLETGRHHRTDNPTPFFAPTGPLTISEALWQAGYDTHFVGVWGADKDEPFAPSAKSFDHWYGFMLPLEPEQYYPQLIWRDDQPVREALNQNGKPAVSVHELFLNEVERIVRRECRQRDPFYLQIQLPYPLLPVPVADRWGYNTMDWTAEEIAYASRVSAVDQLVGLIQDELEHAGDLNNTLLVVTGFPAETPDAITRKFNRNSGREARFALSDSELRAPLIMAWNQGNTPASVSDIPAAQWDIFPTLAASALRFPFPRHLAGASLISLLDAAPGQPRMLVWKELRDGQEVQAVRWGQWKALLIPPGNDVKLYDMTRFPLEQTDVSDEHPEIIKQLIMPAVPKKQRPL